MSSNSAWAQLLLKKKQQKDEEEEKEVVEKAKPKLDPKAEALARVPCGHLRLRGVLVPSGFEGDLNAWRYLATSPVRGWTTQHSGPLRMHSIWVRTSHAWYWLRVSPPTFACASIWKIFWTPPGMSSTAAMPEELLVASPVAAAYASLSLLPPPRGVGVAALPAIAAEPFASADAADASAAAAAAAAVSDGLTSVVTTRKGRAFRMSAFFFKLESGESADLFSALPNGLRSAGEAAAGGGGGEKVVHLCGQLMPSVGGGAAGGKPEGSGIEGAWPARMWLRSLPVHEWRLQPDASSNRGAGAAGGGGEAGSGSAGKGGQLKVWVRSESSWFQLHKPRADVVWRPPGTRDKPLDELLLPSTVETTDKPPFANVEKKPCRTLHGFTVHRHPDGSHVPLLDVLQ